MKKLLQINVIANSLSTGRIAEGIGLSAMNAGWDSYIAYGRWANPSHSKLIKIGNNMDYYNHYIQTRLFDNHGLASKNSTRKFLDAVDIIRPDIVHLHNIHGYYINYDILFDYLAKKGIPVVWTLHDCWPITGHCTYFDIVNCNKWETGCRNCNHKYLYPRCVLKNRSEKNFQLKKNSFTSVEKMVMVPVSDWLGKFIRRSYMAKYPIKVIHNGIDLNDFSPADKSEQIEMKKALGISPDVKIILGVAKSFGKRKGFDEFLKLSSLLTSNYIIIMVGVSDDEIKKLPSNVIGIKRTENLHKLTVLYSLADVFINPTLEDNYPTTNLEAMACGTPVITYQVGGSPEAVTPETGIVIEKGDVEGLAKAINDICYKIDSYSVKCRERALCYFGRDDRYKEYLDLYDKLLNR